VLGGSAAVLIVDQMAFRSGFDPVIFPLVLSVPSHFVNRVIFILRAQR